jgi:hypothetical protein
MLVDDVVAALNAREWPEYVLERLGPRIGDAVAPHLVPVVGASLRAEPDADEDQASGDRSNSGDGDDSGDGEVIYVPDPGPLRVATAPAGLNVEDGVFAERALTFGPSLCLEEQDEEGHYVTVRFDHAVEKAIDEELLARGGADCGNLQMLGRVHPFRSETAETFDEETTELLLYVNGYTTARYAFGEGDFLVVIDRDQLAAGHLDAADVLFEPGT